MKYKLGPKSSFFYDAQTGFMLYPDEEKEIPQQKKTKKVQKAISAGHIIMVEDPNASKAEPPVVEREIPKFESMADLKQGVLRTMKIEDIKSVVEQLGFDEEDMEKVNEIIVKKDLIPFVLEAAKGYQDEGDD